MVEDLIITKSGKINDYLHLIDVKAYGTQRMLSVFLGEFDEGSVLLECGSSLDIKNVLRYFKKHNVSLSSFKYLITTHHHFDHNGGLWKLYNVLKKHNPNVKILTNTITKELLNDFEHHMKRGSRTYGNLTGVMKPIEDSAFQIIEPSTLDNIEIIDTFHIEGSEVRLCIIQTPGHTPDHQSPAFLKDNDLDFIHYGEAMGTIYHRSKLLSMPTSMPIYFNYDKYMKTLESLRNTIPIKAGFGHFGLVQGKENVQTLLLEHKSFMKTFREKIDEFYNEKPETKYVLEKIKPFINPRTDLSIDNNPVLNGITLGIVYGMLVSLGYRSISEEELYYYNKFYSL